MYLKRKLGRKGNIFRVIYFRFNLGRFLAGVTENAKDVTLKFLID